MIDIQSFMWTVVEYKEKIRPRRHDGLLSQTSLTTRPLIL